MIDLNGIDADNNKPKNKWKLMRIEEDHPDLKKWGNRMRLCNCATDQQLILWAVHLVTHRWDFSRIKLSHGTLQEIDPPTEANFHPIGKVIEGLLSTILRDLSNLDSMRFFGAEKICINSHFHNIKLVTSIVPNFVL